MTEETQSEVASAVQSEATRETVIETEVEVASVQEESSCVESPVGEETKVDENNPQ